MGKKIIIGSMLVLTLLLLMPSIPAIQQKAIEQLDDVDLINVKEINNNGDRLKHPLLYLSVFLVAFRGIRGFFLMFSSSKNMFSWEEPMEIIYPFIFLRGVWLCGTTFLWQEFWVSVANNMGWNWGLQ